MKKTILVALLMIVTLTLSACLPAQAIVIGEGNWDSNAFHSQVAKILIEEGYGKTVDIVPADTTIMIAGLKTGDVNLSLEVWSDNIVTYDDDIAAGDYVELSTNFDDNMQGLYIPAYLQEQYPGLVSVSDLADYTHLFPNPDGNDAIIYGGPEGWAATDFLSKKIEAYDLDELYTFKSIDSSSTLNATLASAYANEEPWVGYNWEPTWVIGLYDMVLLEDSEYSADDYENGIGAFPTVDVNVCVDAEFETNYPEVFEMLSNYETSSTVTSAALAYMQENDVDALEAAIWFLNNYEDMWSAWVSDEAYNNISDFLNE